MSKVIRALLVAALLLLAVPVGAQDVVPAWLGAQWGPGGTGVHSCGAANTGGNSCLYFPNGGRVRAIDFQAVMKGGSVGILAILTMSTDPAVFQCCHSNLTQVTLVWPVADVRTLTLPQGGLVLAAGTYVWVYSLGYAAINGWELHATLWVDKFLPDGTLTAFTIILPGQVH